MIQLLETLSVWDVLRKTTKPVLLYGMGNGADKILAVCEEKGIRVDGVFASDGFCRGHCFRQFPVVSYSQAKEQYGQMAVLLAFGTGREDVLENIRKIDREQELYAPDVPVCGGDLFDFSFYEAHLRELEEAYGMLSDDQSRKTFSDILAYKISGKLSYLADCETDPGEAFGILELNSREVYLDAGAYTGDTVREFLRHAGGYERIIAMEPDNRNYEKLLRSVDGMDNVQCLRTAVYSRTGTISFAGRAGRNSSFAAAAGEEVAADSIDAIANGLAVTYIKLDVEGMEKEALLGAEATIAAHMPKMLVSAYHKSEDMFALPLLVKSMQPGYRLYMRHFRSYPAWDTNYYFVPAK